MIYWINALRGPKFCAWCRAKAGHLEPSWWSLGRHDCTGLYRRGMYHHFKHHDKVEPH